VDLRAARYAGVVLMGVACGPMWPVVVMTTNVSCGLERRTSAVIGMGAIGFASGPLLGSLLLKAGLAAHFFRFELLLGLLVLGLSLSAGARYRGTRRR
jgi:MFS family permease